MKLQEKKALSAKTIKFIIVLTVLIDVIGFGIVIPILPFYVESFGASSFMVTVLFSVFALFSFVSGPFLGAVSDRIGRRPVLILSIASTAIGWFVFASAHSLWILFLGRIIDGLAAGNFPIAQSYLVDIAKTDKERTSNLGIIGAVWGIGLILGPAVGASLSSFGTSFPFWFVGCLATLNAIGAYFFLPETHMVKNKQKRIEINPLKPLVSAVKFKELRARYFAWFLFGIAIAVQQSIFALFAKEVFGFSSAVTGYLFTATGVILLLNQAVALKRIWLKYFNELDLERWFFLVLIVGFLFLGQRNVIFFLLGIFLVTIGQSTLRSVLSSVVAGAAGPQRRGEAMGVMASIMSVSMIIGPVLGGALFEINLQFPFFANVPILIPAYLIMRKYGLNEKVEKKEDVNMSVKV